MATIRNERDLILQGTVPRVLPWAIPIENVSGLPAALSGITLSSSVLNFLNLTPSSATLTLHRSGNATTGTPIWTVAAGTAIISGTADNTRTVNASSIPIGTTAIIQVTVGSHIATIPLSRSSVLATQSTVNLTSQVTGSLASGNVSGLGALALLNTVDLNTQTTGALNGLTQVNNLGTLAYANAIAANQIGAGTLAAGVIYAGTINADNINSGILTGRTIRTAVSGARAVLASADQSNPHRLEIYRADSGSTPAIRLAPDAASFITGAYALRMFEVFNTSSSGAPEAIHAEANWSNGIGLYVRGGGACIRAEPMSGSIGLHIIEPASNGIGFHISVGQSPGGILRNNSSQKVYPDLELGTSALGGVLKLHARSTFPTTKDLGHIMLHTTHGLCIADGSVWRKTDGTAVG